jgi:uncharacterized protein YqcC (DUF446 family)
VVLVEKLLQILGLSTRTIVDTNNFCIETLLIPEYLQWVSAVVLLLIILIISNDSQTASNDSLEQPVMTIYV